MIIDISETTIGKGYALGQAGIVGVIRYCSPNTQSHPTKCITLDEAHALHDAGIAVGLVYEIGDTIAEFATGNGTQHAEEALHVAHTIGWMSPSIYVAADNDFSDTEARGLISDSCREWQAIIKPAGGLVRGYGSGLVLSILSDDGLIHGAGWLDQSAGHAGHAEWLHKVDLVQLAPSPADSICGLATDRNVIRPGLSLEDAGFWLP